MENILNHAESYLYIKRKDKLDLKTDHTHFIKYNQYNFKEMSKLAFLNKRNKTDTTTF